jgi:hypothetical protein
MTSSKNTVSFATLTTKAVDEDNMRRLGKGAGGDSANEGEQVDENGRITKGPFTLKNGAVYTGQWLMGMRDGFGTQLWPDGSRYEGQWRNDKANG